MQIYLFYRGYLKYNLQRREHVGKTNLVHPRSQAREILCATHEITFTKYVRSLEEKCLITTEHTTVTLKLGKRQNGNLLYTIRPIKEAVDYFNAQQLRKAERETANLNVICKPEEYDRKYGIIGGNRSSLFEAG